MKKIIETENFRNQCECGSEVKMKLFIQQLECGYCKRTEIKQYLYAAHCECGIFYVSLPKQMFCYCDGREPHKHVPIAEDTD